MIRVSALCGSLRTGSYNQALLREAAARGGAHGLEIVQGDISRFPLFDQDFEKTGIPPEVDAVKALVRSSACLMLVTPEYNYGVPGVLKNAYDFLSRPPLDSPLRELPMALLGASTGMQFGTLRAQMAWRQTALFLRQPVFMDAGITIPRAASAFDERGALVDETWQGLLEDYLEKLRAWLERGCR